MNKILTAGDRAFSYMSASVLEQPIAVATVRPVQKPSAPRSACDRPVKKVFEIAEDMAGRPRKDVIAACVAAGVNPSTARTQYQIWFTVWKGQRKA